MSTSTAKPTCVVLRSDGTYDGKQGFTYEQGISTETVGSKGLCMHMLRIPPKGRAKVHFHESHETAIYVISGEAEMWYGDNLEEYALTGPGDWIYIPAGVPHLPQNPSETETCVCVLARTDPNEQESVVLRPDLESKVPAI